MDHHIIVSTLKSVEADLYTLSVDSRKKHPNVKQASERALQRLRSIHKAPDDQILNALQTDLLLRPFLVACATKSPQLTVLALGTIQRLFTVNCVSADSFSTIIGTLRVQAESGDDFVQLKILQTLLLATSEKSFQVDEDALRQALGICFRLRDVKSPMIQNTASAALGQVMTLLFDYASGRHRAADGSSSAHASDAESEPEALKDDLADSSVPLRRSAYLLFLDVCAMTRGDPGKWLQINTNRLAGKEGIQLIDSVLTRRENRNLFLTVPAFTTLLKEQVCPLVVSYLRSEFDFPLLVRVVRLVCTLAKNFYMVLPSEIEVFMSTLIRQLEPEYALWIRIVTLETLSQLCAVPELLHFFYVNYDMTKDTTVIFGSIAHCLGRFVHQTASEAAESSGDGSASSVGQVLGAAASAAAGAAAGHSHGGGVPSKWRFDVSQSRGLDMLTNESGPPEFDEMQAVSISTQALIRMVNGLAELERRRPCYQQSSSSGRESKELKDDSGDADANVSTPKATPSRSPSSSGAKQSPPQWEENAASVVPESTLTAMVAVAWRPILTAFSMLLERCNDEEQIQHLLIAYQSITNTCGLIGMVPPRDQFLRNLRVFALPKKSQGRHLQEVASAGVGVPNPADIPSELSPKNIQAMKALFNLAHCLGGVLGSSSWLLMLETFEELDRIMLAHEKKMRSQQTKSWNQSNKKNAPGSHSSRHRSQSRSRPPQESDHHGVGGRQSPQSGSPVFNEMSQLKMALSQLFESSRILSFEAINDVLNALGTLSLSSLANAAATENFNSQADLPSRNDSRSQAAATQPSPRMRMFALVSLVTTIEHNMFRIDRLWDVAVSHLNCVINHKNASIRQYGMECLTRLAIQALAFCGDPRNVVGGSGDPPAELLSQPSPTGDRQRIFFQPNRSRNYHAMAQNGAADSTAVDISAVSPAVGEAKTAPGENTGSFKDDFTASGNPQKDKTAFQRAILAPFLELYRLKYDDVRANILGSLYEMLDKCGQKIEAGWPAVLKLLKAVAQEDPLPVHSHVFRSIQQIANHFLECLSPSSLQEFIETIGLYGVQKTDPNISYTSVGLLWDVSDHLTTIIRTLSASTSSKDKQASPSSPAPTDGNEPDSSANEQAVADLSPSFLTLENCDALQVSVFLQLQRLSTDHRPEVRNSAVQTVHGAIVAHGPQMSRDAWTRCLKDIVDRLLHDVFRSAGDMSASPAPSIQLGKEKGTGKAVMMMIHHSRNTAEKQWDETRVHVLQGTSRVYRMFFGTLSALKGFDESWKLHLRTLERSIVGASVEVATSAISALQEVVSSAQTIEILAADRTLWLEVLKLFADSVPVVAVGQDSQQDTPFFDVYRALLVTLKSLVEHDAPTRKLFADTDLKLVFALCDSLCRVSLTRADDGSMAMRLQQAHGIYGTKETPLQRETLGIFDTIFPLSKELWDVALRQLIRYVQRVASPAAAAAATFRSATKEGKTSTTSTSSSTSGAVEATEIPSAACEFSKKSLVVLTRLFCHEAPKSTRADVFEDVISTASAVMNRRQLPEDIRTIAVRSFIQFVEVGLPALNQVGHTDSAASVRIWTLIANTLARFVHPHVTPHTALPLPLPGSRSPSKGPTRGSVRLVPPSDRTRGIASSANGHQRSESTSSLSSDEEDGTLRPFHYHVGSANAPPDASEHEVRLQIELVQCTVNVVLPNSKLAPAAIQRRIIGLLNVSTHSQLRPGGPIHPSSGKLPQACLSGLFSLCRQAPADLAEDSVSGASRGIDMMIASLAFPMLMLRCGEVLRWYLADERQAGECPLPQERRHEVEFVLRELVTLDVHPSTTKPRAPPRSLASAHPNSTAAAASSAAQSSSSDAAAASPNFTTPLQRRRRSDLDAHTPPLSLAPHHSHSHHLHPPDQLRSLEPISPPSQHLHLSRNNSGGGASSSSSGGGTGGALLPPTAGKSPGAASSLNGVSIVHANDGTYPFPGVSRRKAHLLRLFPVLCECVAIRDDAIRQVLKDVLHEVSRELGLES